MIYENWLKTSSSIKTPLCSALDKDIKSDFLVIGGGISGLHAALRLVDSGKEVILLEKNTCASSSSGQSGGFLTPETEEDLAALIKRYGKKRSRVIYGIPVSGMNMIINNVKKYGFNCDLRKQDSFYFSMKDHHNHKIEEEAETRKEHDLPYEILRGKKLKSVHPGKDYLLALRYPGSYGINSFAYCQEMKNLLLKKGVKIYEGSEVHRIQRSKAVTHLGSVTAKKIVICVDKLKEEIDDELSKKYYHLQTYVAISEPLSSKEMKALFPKGELMCWDTRWDYRYYRPVYGNRLLVGGSSAWTAYLPKYFYSPSVIESVISKVKENFPEIEDVEFPYYWSGLIDVTKDLVPIVDYDRNNKNIQYVMGCAGLNWAAYCGDYAAKRALSEKTEDLDEFLRSQRKFFISGKIQKFLGKRTSFFLSHLKNLLEG